MSAKVLLRRVDDLGSSLGGTRAGRALGYAQVPPVELSGRGGRRGALAGLLLGKVPRRTRGVPRLKRIERGRLLGRLLSESKNAAEREVLARQIRRRNRKLMALHSLGAVSVPVALNNILGGD